MNHRVRMRTIAAISALCLALCLAACAPKANTGDPARASEEKDSAPIATVEWSVDSECAVCHSIEADTLDAIPCMSGMEAKTACVSCHTDESALAAVHEGVTAQDKMPKRLKSTFVSESACEACHESYDELAAKTADSTVLTDNKGKTVNPHAMPSSESHDQLTCGDCHSMHDSGDVRETAPKACSSCHHAGAYECGTCHEKK